MLQRGCEKGSVCEEDECVWGRCIERMMNNDEKEDRDARRNERNKRRRCRQNGLKTLKRRLKRSTSQEDGWIKVAEMILIDAMKERNRKAGMKIVIWEMSAFERLRDVKQIVSEYDRISLRDRSLIYLFIYLYLHKWVRISLGVPFIRPCATSKWKKLKLLVAIR